MTNLRMPGIGGRASRRSVAVVELADMMLGIELEAEPADEIELGFEEVDMTLLVAHQLLEQIAGHVILHAVAMRRRFLVERTRRQLGLEIAIENFLDRLADV